MPKVSVLMNCYNGERYLREAIDSVYAQTFTDWEIIFIDNASTDQSATIAKSYDARLKYYNTQKTIPLYAARNFSLQYMRGEFIAFLDVDDAWMPEKLAAQLAIMEDYSFIYLVCSGYLLESGNKKIITRQVSKNARFLTFQNTLNNYIINLSTVILRYDSISKNKIQFETSLNLTGDYELFMKFVHTNAAYYIAEPLILWRQHGANLSVKLIHEWPRELAETHQRWEQELLLSENDKIAVDKFYRKGAGLVYLYNGEYKKARKVVKKYLFYDVKLSIIYFVAWNKLFVKGFRKLKGI